MTLVPSRKFQAVGAETLSQIGAEECFILLGKQLDEFLNLEEYIKWYQSLFPSEILGSSQEWDRYGQLFRFDKVKELLGLEDLYLREVLDLCSKNCDMPNGTISEQKFVSTIASLVPQEENVVDPTRRRVLIRVLAKILDVNKQGSIEISHISAALSLLCKTKEIDKIKAAFAIFDQNQDGYISFVEMKQYLTIVFMVRVSLVDFCI